MIPQEQPDSQAGDELDTLLEQIASDSGFYEDADFRHIHPKAKVAIADYAERLATEARIDELNKVSNWELPDLYSQPYLESMCDKRIATLTAKADTDEDGDPVQHTTWRKQA